MLNIEAPSNGWLLWPPHAWVLLLSVDLALSLVVALRLEAPVLAQGAAGAPHMGAGAPSTPQFNQPTTPQVSPVNNQPVFSTPNIPQTPNLPATMNLPILPASAGNRIVPGGTAFNGQSQPAIAGVRKIKDGGWPKPDDFKGPVAGILISKLPTTVINQGILNIQNANALGAADPHITILTSGTVLASVRHPSQAALVCTPVGDVSVSAGADVLVSFNNGVMRVRTLNGSDSAVKVGYGGNTKQPGLSGVPDLDAGANALTASPSGGGSVNPLAVTVAPTLTVYGQPVTFTATVSPSGGGSGNPSAVSVSDKTFLAGRITGLAVDPSDPSGNVTTGPGGETALAGLIREPDSPGFARGLFNGHNTGGLVKVGPGELVLANTSSPVAESHPTINWGDGTPDGKISGPSGGNTKQFGFEKTFLDGSASYITAVPSNGGKASPIVRVEGLTELVGDLKVNSSGGTPDTVVLSGTGINGTGALENVSGNNPWTGPIILKTASLPAGGHTNQGNNKTTGGTVVESGAALQLQGSITVAGASGTFTLTFNGQTTNPVAFNATTSQVQSVLNALPSIGGVGGTVAVTQSGSVFTVTFGGSLAGSQQPQLTAVGAGGAKVQAEITKVGVGTLIIPSGQDSVNVSANTYHGSTSVNQGRSASPTGGGTGHTITATYTGNGNFLSSRPGGQPSITVAADPSEGSGNGQHEHKITENESPRPESKIADNNNPIPVDRLTAEHDYGNIVQLAPGFELVVSANLLGQSDLRPSDGTARANSQCFDKGQVAVSVFSVQSALNTNDLLKEMALNPASAREKQILQNISKRAAVLDFLRAQN